MNTQRFHPVFVVIHWLVALGVILGLVVGGAVLSEMPNDSAKIAPLTGHMIAGMVIGVLMLVRIVMRFTVKRPARASTGNAFLDTCAKVSHFLMYVLVLSMVSTGVGLAISSGLFDIVFGGSGAPLPEDFHAYPPKEGHELFAGLLAILVLIHISAALYHQFVLKDGLIGRMWFGKRN